MAFLHTLIMLLVSFHMPISGFGSGYVAHSAATTTPAGIIVKHPIKHVKPMDTAGGDPG